MPANTTTRRLTCIVCPRGCELTVTLTKTDGTRTVESVTGNLCPRGMTYAIDECTHPTRTLTTTVRTTDGGVVAVKTETPIPKESLFTAMAAVNALIVPTPVHVGDVLAENIAGSRLVATGEHS